MKVFEKLKKIGKRCKAAVVACAVAVSGVITSVCASAASTEANGVNMEQALTEAGNQMTSQFGSLVTTLIPVIIGILGAGLVIFGILQLIKLAKKTFGKVAG